MDDLIRRQDAIEVLATMQGRCRSKSALIQNSKIWQQIKDLPSAEPEIIRCKDCVKCGFCGDETNLEIMGFNGFCSRAKRRKIDG